MKLTYETPDLHEVGAADAVVQGTKQPGGSDSATGPLRLDVSALYELPEMQEVGTADTVVRGTKTIGNVDSGTSPYRFEQMADR
jgi:hypothetical protein